LAIRAANLILFRFEEEVAIEPVGEANGAVVILILNPLLLPIDEGEVAFLLAGALIPRAVAVGLRQFAKVFVNFGALVIGWETMVRPVFLRSLASRSAMMRGLNMLTLP